MEYGLRDYSGNSYTKQRFIPVSPGEVGGRRTQHIYPDFTGHLEYSQFSTRKSANELETHKETKILIISTTTKSHTFRF